MKRLIFYMFALAFLAACGESAVEKQTKTKRQLYLEWRKDSAALKVAVMPTLDCLPLYVAEELRLYDTAVVDLRLKRFMAQMDCDTALANGSVDGGVTDLIRADRLKRKGTGLRYVSATDAYWLLVSNPQARIKKTSQMPDKTVAMARFSVTDYLSRLTIEQAKLTLDTVFQVQINDVALRLRMLQNNELDMICATEPQASAVRKMGGTVLNDTRKLDFRAGVIVFRDSIMKQPNRERQLEALTVAYNKACDEINSKGVRSFATLLEQKMGVQREMLDTIPEITFSHITPPRQKDIETAETWNTTKK